jgi:hypothetical protein
MLSINVLKQNVYPTSQPDNTQEDKSLRDAFETVRFIGLSSNDVVKRISNIHKNKNIYVCQKIEPVERTSDRVICAKAQVNLVKRGVWAHGRKTIYTTPVIRQFKTVEGVLVVETKNSLYIEIPCPGGF